MIIKMAVAFLLAFLVTTLFGKFLIPWLKRRGFSQPLKVEVAQIYAGNDHSPNNKQSV